ncbi:MAG TPA: RNA 2',3'-cyclic phosphodiesterase [Mycobacteriales bacterium]|nr:RNA 2',3'-cyclic phosphodiesterase [Mycobacteriales bacterium]
MRVFVAVSPPEHAIGHLAGAVDGCVGLPGAPRWTPAERWHLTLAFLGEIEESTMDRIAARLDTVTGVSLRLAIEGAGTFPERGEPRVLWAGLSGDIAALESLAKRIRIAVRAARITLERRPFRPHLTLGRWRPGDPSGLGVLTALREYRGPEFEVTRFSLIRSHLGPQPRYEVLREWPLH